MQVAGENSFDVALSQQLEQTLARLRFDIPILTAFLRSFAERRIMHENNGGHGARLRQFLFQKTPHRFFSRESAAENWRVQADDAKPRPLSRKKRRAAAQLEASDPKRIQAALALFAGRQLIA